MVAPFSPIVTPFAGLMAGKHEWSLLRFPDPLATSALFSPPSTARPTGGRGIGGGWNESENEKEYEGEDEEGTEEKGNTID